MNTISLKDFLECIEYKITEGSDFAWTCYGPNVQQLTTEKPTHSISAVFDTETQFVYEMEAWDYDKDRVYRWIHPDYIKAVKAEYKKLSLKFRSHGDGKYIDVDEVVDILEKATAIARGEEYDPRLIVGIDIDDASLLVLMKHAHSKDITFNQLFTEIIQDEISRSKASA